MSFVARIVVIVSTAALSLVPGCSSGDASTPSITKVLVFVEENHSLREMKSGMPYTFSLAQKYGYATNWKAIAHPSLPNYLAIASGSTHGVTDDVDPASHPLSGADVFDQAIAKGKRAKTYADGMQSKCALTAGGADYVPRHNPWTYFTNGLTHCNAYDVPFANSFTNDVNAGTLPNVGFVVPNLCHDAHNCSLATADDWFKARMQTVFAGPDWRSGHLAVVLTADEDDSTQGNTVLTVVIHPSQAGHVVTTALSHYSLTRFLEDVVGASHLGNASTAPNMATAFALPLN